MTRLRPFALDRPASLEEVAALVAEHGGEAALYAGGTELLLLLKEGLLRVQRLIDLIKKDITLEQSREAVRLCKETGIQTWCSFILGLPSETEEESWQTIRFAIELDPDFVQFPIFMPWPGTDLYDIAKEHGTILNENLSNYGGWDHVVYAPRSDRNPDDVRRIVQRAYRTFYLRPLYILRRGADLLLHFPKEKIWKLMKSAYYTLG